ncbi:rubrerythrin-like domain-containing protein [Halobaculum marinum]|uniref:Rubrerythrin-like domain-containing protein n=1 Tax=Halobaculum marinum TaxID=3031996 RepID=A0ABD5WZP3_9EURY|nr:rubrerythrin-like domain-containing protein [Halobaculum sp. DT55]
MRSDPYQAGSVRVFECRECSARVEASHSPGTCSDCGGDLQDISVPRE